jgi:hypothetical protein
MKECIAPSTTIHTDEHAGYPRAARDFAGRESVSRREKKYVQDGVTTNAAEGFFSRFKRSVCSDERGQAPDAAVPDGVTIQALVETPLSAV